MDSWHERTTCRLCDAPLPEERVLDLGFSPLANLLRTHPDVGPCDEYPLYLVQCTTCGHVQLPVVVDPKLLFPADYPYASATGASMRKHLEKMALDLLWSPPKRPFVVEFGSNDGYLLRQFWRNGCRVIGVDPAGKVAREGVLTAPAFFDVATAEAIKNSAGEADLIVANNVFAHADDLNEIVEGVKALLSDDGRFVFEVGYLPDVVRTNNFGTVYHEHLSYHHLAPLAEVLFKRHGLSVYDAHRVPTQGGSIRVYVRRSGGPSERTKRCNDLIADEAGFGIAEQLAKWQARVNRAGAYLNASLGLLKETGNTIAAYGCSAKSTTLLHVAGIGRETIDFICDDAPSKQGKFSPGKHIPIVPGSWLEEKQPDYCVSLSGNFTEEFKAGHPGFKGEWLEPQLT